MLRKWHEEDPDKNPLHDPDQTAAAEYFISREDLDTIAQAYRDAAEWLVERCISKAALATEPHPTDEPGGPSERYNIIVRPIEDAKDSILAGYSTPRRQVGLNVPVLEEADASDRIAVDYTPWYGSSEPRQLAMASIMEAVIEAYAGRHEGDHWLFRGLAEGIATVYGGALHAPGKKSLHWLLQNHPGIRDAAGWEHPTDQFTSAIMSSYMRFQNCGPCPSFIRQSAVSRSGSPPASNEIVNQFANVTSAGLRPNPDVRNTAGMREPERP